MNCNTCDQCFIICDPFQSCFSELKVKEPFGYAPSDIIIKITNGQSVAFEQQCAIEDDTATLDLTLFPDGFFSAYGGPYILEFFDVESGEKINFVATNGNNYNCIQFEFRNGSEVETVTILA